MFEVQAFRYRRSFALQFHPDVTHAMMHHWTTRGMCAWKCRAQNRARSISPIARSTTSVRAPGLRCF
jgi:hypothetical protein